MLLIFFKLILVFCLTVQCLQLKITKLIGSKVVGGEKANKIYPYQLSLQKNDLDKNQSSHMCGGVVLNENYFLTAAHCIKGQNVSRLSVLAGTSNLKEENKGSRHPIDSCLVHPDYVILNTSDIALCKLKLPFVFSERLFKINIDKTYVGGKVNSTLTGWGSVKMFRWLPIPFYSYFAYPDDLQQANYLTMTNEECAKTGLNIDNTQICVSKPFFQGSCAGDSGGPLVNNGTLVGLVSYGTSICAIGMPDVYTRVSYFYDWINSKISLKLASSSNPDVQALISNIPEILTMQLI